MWDLRLWLSALTPITCQSLLIIWYAIALDCAIFFSNTMHKTFLLFVKNLESRLASESLPTVHRWLGGYRGSSRRLLKVCCSSGVVEGRGQTPHLGGGRGLHGGQDAHHLGSLRGGDVLGHVHDGIHGDLWIGLDEAAVEKAERNKISTCLPSWALRDDGLGPEVWGKNYLRICLRMWSRRMYLMFSSMTDLAPSSSASCLSSHATTSSLLSHR